MITGVWNLWVNKKQFGWYIRCSAIEEAFSYHKCARWWHQKHFMTLTLLPTCLQRYLPELFLEVDFICWGHFITDMIVYTYAEFGMNCFKSKWNITHCSECCVGSCFSIAYIIEHGSLGILWVLSSHLLIRSDIEYPFISHFISPFKHSCLYRHRNQSRL